VEWGTLDLENKYAGDVDFRGIDPEDCGAVPHGMSFCSRETTAVACTEFVSVVFTVNNHLEGTGISVCST
jgi:hypothetical protein